LKSIKIRPGGSRVLRPIKIENFSTVEKSLLKLSRLRLSVETMS
jgi:hypothetical protein